MKLFFSFIISDWKTDLHVVYVYILICCESLCTLYIIYSFILISFFLSLFKIISTLPMLLMVM